MSDHYGPWHSHDSAPQMGLCIGLADVKNKNIHDYKRSHMQPVPMGCHTNSCVAKGVYVCGRGGGGAESFFRGLLVNDDPFSLVICSVLSLACPGGIDIVVTLICFPIRKTDLVEQNVHHELQEPVHSEAQYSHRCHLQCRGDPSATLCQ